jgi:hypothetical protein
MLRSKSGASLMSGRGSKREPCGPLIKLRFLVSCSLRSRHSGRGRACLPGFSSHLDWATFAGLVRS